MVEFNVRTKFHLNIKMKFNTQAKIKFNLLFQIILICNFCNSFYVSGMK